jgi:hypothetical protein
MPQWFRRAAWLHFLLIGGALLLLYRAVAPRPPGRTIVVTGAVRDGLRADWRRRTGTLPSADEERGLVRRWVDNEVLYREALAAGLDRGDTIVRRRLVQKMEFLLDAAADAREPTDRELAQLLAAEPNRFARPARLGFEHVFVARDRHANPPAEAARLAALLDGGAAAATLGDPFVRGRRFAGVSPREVANIFGPAFARAVSELPLDGTRWSAPIVSSFGLHLVRVTAREPGALPALAEVREPLRTLWRERERTTLRQAGLERLRRRYVVR